MTDLAAAVATLRLPRSADLVSKGTRVASRAEHEDAVACVEAELARLTQQVAEQKKWIDRVSIGSTEAATAAEAAERALAETREAARAVLNYEHTPSRASLSRLREVIAGLSASPEGEPAPQEPYAPTAQEWADAHDPQEPQP